MSKVAPISDSLGAISVAVSSHPRLSIVNAHSGQIEIARELQLYNITDQPTLARTTEPAITSGPTEASHRPHPQKVKVLSRKEISASASTKAVKPRDKDEESDALRRKHRVPSQSTTRGNQRSTSDSQLSATTVQRQALVKTKRRAKGPTTVTGVNPASNQPSRAPAANKLLSEVRNNQSTNSKHHRLPRNAVTQQAEVTHTSLSTLPDPAPHRPHVAHLHNDLITGSISNRVQTSADNQNSTRVTTSVNVLEAKDQPTSSQESLISSTGSKRGPTDSPVRETVAVKKRTRLSQPDSNAIQFPSSAPQDVSKNVDVVLDENNENQDAFPPSTVMRERRAANSGQAFAPLVLPKRSGGGRPKRQSLDTEDEQSHKRARLVERDPRRVVSHNVRQVDVSARRPPRGPAHRPIAQPLPVVIPGEASRLRAIERERRLKAALEKAQHEKHIDLRESTGRKRRDDVSLQLYLCLARDLYFVAAPTGSPGCIENEWLSAHWSIYVRHRSSC